MTDAPAPLLTVVEVARILKVPRQRVYALKERIGYVRLSEETIRFRAEHVLAYIEAHTLEPPAARTSTRGASRQRPPPGGMPLHVPISRRVAEVRERLRSGSRRGNKG